MAAFSDVSKAFESNSNFSMDDDMLMSRIELWSFNQGNSCSGVSVLRQALQLVTADGYSPDCGVGLLFFKFRPTCVCILCPQSISTT